MLHACKNTFHSNKRLSHLNFISAIDFCWKIINTNTGDANFHAHPPIHCFLWYVSLLLISEIDNTDSTVTVYIELSGFGWSKVNVCFELKLWFRFLWMLLKNTYYEFSVKIKIQYRWRRMRLISVDKRYDQETFCRVLGVSSLCSLLFQTEFKTVSLMVGY